MFTISPKHLMVLALALPAALANDPPITMTRYSDSSCQVRMPGNWMEDRSPGHCHHWGNAEPFFSWSLRNDYENDWSENTFDRRQRNVRVTFCSEDGCGGDEETQEKGEDSIGYMIGGCYQVGLEGGARSMSVSV